MKKVRDYSKAYAIWDHFIKQVWPFARKGASAQDLNKVNVAQRDRLGKVVKGSGKPVLLGEKRIRKLLEKHAAGIYDLEAWEILPEAENTPQGSCPSG